jgi:hypothetical protein
MNKEKRLKALNELYKQTAELYDSYENKEEFWDAQHWVNNPLINPSDKVRMLKEQGEIEFQNGRKYERELIKKKLDEEIKGQQKERVAMKDPVEKSQAFLFISGLNLAKMIIKWVENDGK